MALFRSGKIIVCVFKIKYHINLARFLNRSARVIGIQGGNPHKNRCVKKNLNYATGTHAILLRLDAITK